MPRRKRPYSYEFSGDAANRIDVARVPGPLFRAAKAQAKRDGVSLRIAILRLLTHYVAGNVSVRNG